MIENTRRIADLQRDLAVNPGSRQFYQLGELLRRDGHAAEAAQVLRSGLAHHPRYVAAWVSLGRACIEAGESTEAVNGLREALALDPGNPVAWRLLGEAYLALGQRPRALEAMARCLELVPGDEVLQAAVDALSSDAAAPDPAAAAEAPPLPAPPAEEPFGGSAPAPVVEPAPASPAGAAAAFAQPTPAAAVEPLETRTAVARAEEFMAGAAAAGPPALAAVVEPASAPLVGFEFEPDAPPAPVAAMPTAVTLPPAVPAVEPPLPEAAFEEAYPAPAGVGLAQPPPEAFLAEPAAAAPVPAAPPDSDLFTVPETDQAPALLKAVLQASAAQAATEPVQPPASLTLARLYVQQQALGEAVAVLERLLEREPGNVEAGDLLALVRDMMVPLPEEPPPLDPRERKIAALQRWLASLTLGEERALR